MRGVNQSLVSERVCVLAADVQGTWNHAGIVSMQACHSFINYCSFSATLADTVSTSLCTHTVNNSEIHRVL